MKFIGSLLDNHLQRYPRMQLEDIYKLLHQAALGSGHAVSELAARERLRLEMDAAEGGPQEPLIDPISPDGRMARIHLRAYDAAGHAPEILLQAFVDTAEHWPAAPDKLARFCACLGDLAEQGRIPFTRDAVESHMTRMHDSGNPAVRHSAIYHQAYQPAYRVVWLDHLKL